MPFSLTEIELEHALQQSGCPLCRIALASAERYLRHLLWESVNDGETRLHFLNGMGYCPAHTSLLAAREIEEHGDALGITIMYENLLAVAVEKLGNWQPAQEVDRKKPPAPRRQRNSALLRPASPCRVCQVADQATQYALESLLQGLETASAHWRPIYLASSGLCLNHFQKCAQSAASHLAAVQFIHEDLRARLDRWRESLQGYSRKRIWESPQGSTTEKERRAWVEVLAFFTGQLPESFPGENRHAC